MSWSRVRIVRLALLSLGGVFITLLLLLGAVSLAIYTESGSRRISQLVLDRLNQLEGIELTAGAINGNLLRGLTFTELTVHLPTAEIQARSLQASWNPYTLLSGSAYLTAVTIDNLAVSLIEDPAATGNEGLDIKALLQWQPLPVAVAIGELRVTSFTLSSNGQSFGIEELAVAASLAGQRLLLQDLQLRSSAVFLDLDLQLDLAGNIPLQASANWEYQGPIFADYELAVGSGALTGDLDGINIEHELLAPESIHSSGTIRNVLSEPDRGFEFVHSAETLRLPFAGLRDYLFDNPQLTTRWAGTDLLLELNSIVSSDILPLMQVSAQGALQSGAIQIDSARFTTDSGVLHGAGMVDWSGQLQTAFNFELEEQDPQSYLQAPLPINLHNVVTNGNVSLQFIDDERHIAFSLENFQGFIDDYELHGQATVSMVDDAVQIDTLRLNTIDNEIVVSGNYSEALNIDWQIDAPALNQLLSGISGAVTGSGKLEGALDNPSISASLQGIGVEVGAAYINTIDLTVTGNRNALRSTVRVEEVDYLSEDITRSIEQVVLQLDGNLAQHRLRGSVESQYGNLVMTLAGGIGDTSNMTWQGALDQAQLRSDFGDWTKQGATTPISLSATSLNIPETCWRQLETLLCLQLVQESGTPFRLVASLQNFPLSDFNADTIPDSMLISHTAFPKLPQGIDLAGSVSANLNGVFGAGVSPSMNFNLTASQAQFTLITSEAADAAITEQLAPLSTQQYNWDVFTLRGELEQGNWALSGNAELSQQNIEGTDLGLRGLLDSNLTIDSSGNINGIANARFEELGWLQAFVPDLSAVTGSLSGELEISGSLNAPLFAGDIALNNGSATLERFGVTFDGIRSDIQALSTGQVQLSGAISSNTGNLSFSGNIENLYDDSRQIRLNLSGTDFHLANIPDVNLEISPNLSLSANNQSIHVSGNLDIPVLNLVLTELPETAVDITRDAVVVNYPPDRPELGRSIAASQSTLFNIPVSAEINLTLGDSVTVAGFGMNATLDGDLNIQQQADGRNLTYGELSIVEGNYRIYGQTLNLRQGKLLFFGALDNPALDIRAVREAEGVTVGVLMNGTLKNIRSQLFSTPALPDNDIIAVLVTGRPYSELGEQDGTAVLGAIASLGLDRGEGLTTQIRDTLGLDTFGINSTGNINSSMLTIGKYLTPDIFIHYGVGLFDRQSKVAIDYSLSERIKLQAESGEFQSLDITYTVER